jgi:hypothetical protein
VDLAPDVAGADLAGVRVADAQPGAVVSVEGCLIVIVVELAVLIALVGSIRS